MFATRDQENLIHSQQTHAAAKSMNQGVRGLAPKTPSNNQVVKTPHERIPLRSGAARDENATFGAKSIKTSKNAFVTPVAPRERAPLGNKTTNAKTNALQTPAPLTGRAALPKTSRRSASGKKPKLKVHQPESVENDPVSKEEEDEPEIEYCPPKITELPDVPDDPLAFRPDETFPYLQGKNFSRGWYSNYCNPIGEDGLTRHEREEMEEAAKTKAYVDKLLQDEIETNYPSNNPLLNRSLDAGNPGVKSDNNTGTVSSKANIGASKPSVAQAKAAAAALNGRLQPRFAAPTRSTVAKQNENSTHASLPKRTNGMPVSHGTIGYSKGRQISSSLKQKKNEANYAPSVKHDTKPSASQQMRPEDELFQSLMNSHGDSDSDIDDIFCRGRQNKSDALFIEDEEPSYLPWPPTESSASQEDL